MKIIEHNPELNKVTVGQLAYGPSLYMGDDVIRACRFEGKAYLALQKVVSQNTRVIQDGQLDVDWDRNNVALMNLNSRTIRAVPKDTLVEPIHLEMHIRPVSGLSTLRPSDVERDDMLNDPSCR